MKTIIIIETVTELLEFANPHRQEGDTTPFLGNKAALIFENDMATIRLEGAAGFELAASITIEDIIKVMAKEHYLSAHIT